MSEGFVDCPIEDCRFAIRPDAPMCGHHRALLSPRMRERLERAERSWQLGHIEPHAYRAVVDEAVEAAGDAEAQDRLFFAGRKH